MSISPLPIPDTDIATSGGGVTAEELMRLPIRERMFVVEEATARIQHYAPGLHPWAAITSTLEFFDQVGWGQPVTSPEDPGDFISVTDAYVLEALDRGVALALNGETDDHDNPAAGLWRDYVLRLAADPTWPRRRAEHDRMWAHAEHVATEYGRLQAEQRGACRSEVQYRFYLLSAMYRSLMTDPPALLQRLGAAGPMAWLADVTSPRPVRTAARVAHALAEANPLALATGGVRVGLAYTTHLLT